MSDKIRSPKSVRGKSTGLAAEVTRKAPIGDTAKVDAIAKPVGEAPPVSAAANDEHDVSERPAMSTAELAQLGGGSVAYIKVMTHDEAKRMFPAIEGLPQGISLYALHAADGTPLALTDSRQAAIGQAMGNELAIASLH